MVRTGFGFVCTALWIAVSAFHVSETWPAFTGFKNDQIAEFLATQSADVAFFWIVLGFIWLTTAHFQERADFRRISRKVTDGMREAEAARQQFEAEVRKLKKYETERVRAAQPIWEIQGCIAHKEQHEINLRNTGAAASSIRATWSRELPLVVALSNPVLVDRGQQLTLKVMFQDEPLDNFDVTLEYCDGIRETRKACIAVSEAAVAITHEDC
jgi:hypothetical protein